MLLKDESKFNECVQPLQATMMPVQDPLLFLTMSSSFWGKFWDALYKSEHAAVDAGPSTLWCSWHAPACRS